MVRRLSNRIIMAQEDERRRVALDLHDGIIQLLSSIQFRLQSGRKSKSRFRITDVHEATGLLDKAIGEVRRIAHNLRPSVLDDLGLAAALRSMCEEFSRNSGIAVDFQYPRNASRLPQNVELTLFRTIQEAFNNIEKHSRATRVSLAVEERDGYVHATVQDNGVGLKRSLGRRGQDSKKGMGLDGMKERVQFLGGSVEITSKPRRGVTVSISIPRKPKGLTE